jgi:hypothetical protein
LFSDDLIFWEHLCLVEEELIDDYARGELDDSDRADFERHFLCTDERRGMLEFARALQAYVEQRHTRRQQFWNWLRGPVVAPGWAVAMAAMLVLVVPGVVWRFASARGPRGDVSAWLSPGLVRDVSGDVGRVRLPPGCLLVRLRIDPGSEEHAAYRATVHEVTGDEIWSQDKLTTGTIAGRVAVTLTLPCESLPDGDYYVILRGVSPGAAPVLLHRYDFRVLRQ